MIFDDRQCSLGEGPLWHPKRQSLFWFDINNKQMFERQIGDHEARLWQFDEHVSAAAWVDKATLLVASESALFRFDLANGARENLVALEADNPMTRSNDGRADPYGGFWIGTMGKNAERGAGAIYRYYQGRIQRLFDQITISNAICFAPNKRHAYFCDTLERQIMKVELDDEGWPSSEAVSFIDLRKEGLNPDGAVVDQMGNLWSAQWGASRVACYNPAGYFLEAIMFEASQITCPAFGGDALSTLFVTSANEGLEGSDEAQAGQTFCMELDIEGQEEHQVKL